MNAVPRMTDDQREAEIKRVRRLLAEAQLDDDYEAAGRWARNWAALIEGRSAEVVEQMEKELGGCADEQNRWRS